MLTLAEMNAALRQKYPDKPHVTAKTLSIKLDGALFTTKLARDQPAERNSPRVLQARLEFAEWLCSPEAAQSEFIFIDEFGFNTWMRRAYGRSPRGQRVYRQVSGQKGQRITVCIAVSPSAGIVHFQSYDSGMTKERFGEFVTISIANFTSVFPACRVTVVIDNVSSHNNAESYEVDGIAEIKRLPPYSPFLTPVENAISCWKAALKRQLSAIQDAFIHPTQEQIAGRSLAAYRREILIREVNVSSSCITAAKVARWMSHCYRYLPQCLASQPIDG